METVGIRQFKEHMSRYMRRVRSGERIIVTHRKKKIAVIMPVEGSLDAPSIHRLIRSGIASWSGGRPRGMDCEERVGLKGANVSGAVIEDRR